MYSNTKLSNNSTMLINKVMNNVKVQYFINIVARAIASKSLAM